MRVFLLLTALLTVLSVVCGRNIVNPSPSVIDFPYSGDADATYVWVTAFPALGTGGNLYGTAQLDAKCRDSGPLNSRAIVCSAGNYTSSEGEGYRTAYTYLNYGINQTVPTNAGPDDDTVFQSYKPVYAFNYNSNPTKWVKIADNPIDFIQKGVERVGDAANFEGFFDQNAERNLSNPDPSDTWYGYIPNGVAVTGCFSAIDGADKAGLPQTTDNTCHDWTYASDDTLVARAVAGNLGGENGPYTVETVTNWLNNGNTYKCQGDATFFIYCSWYPTNTDELKNGDEEGIDCGGTTAPDDNLVGTSENSCLGVAATPECSCPCGTYYTQLHGSCHPCPQNEYCHSEEGCIGGCHSCDATKGTTLKPFSETEYDIGQCACRCASGFEHANGYNHTLGAWDGSECQPTVYGDPQITGLQGQDFQVHGIPDEFFNMITHPELQVNARFVYLEEAACDNLTTCFTHPGTYIDQIGMLMGKDNIKLLAGSMEEGLRVFVNGKELSVGTKKQLSTARLVFSTQRKVSVRTPLFSFTFVNSDKFMNQEIALLDEHLAMQGAKKVVLKAGQERPHPEVPLHGLVGQTWQNLVYPEGRYIEGAVADYRLGESELFGTDFPFNKYQQA